VPLLDYLDINQNKGFAHLAIKNRSILNHTLLSISSAAQMKKRAETQRTKQSVVVNQDRKVGRGEGRT
jgi:hypothetical protein